jgi:hypothetical protein
MVLRNVVCKRIIASGRQTARPRVREPTPHALRKPILRRICCPEGLGSGWGVSEALEKKIGEYISNSPNLSYRDLRKGFGLSIGTLCGIAAATLAPADIREIRIIRATLVRRGLAGRK